MRYIQTNAVLVAQQYIGIKEIPGQLHSPMIMSMLQLDNAWVESDETAWCSAFVNWIAFQLGLKRTKSLAARSWLLAGEKLEAHQADVGMDIVILKRGVGNQPGPEVIKAPGHVGFFWSMTPTTVTLLGGNQGDSVNMSTYPRANILGFRRLIV